LTGLDTGELWAYDPHMPRPNKSEVRWVRFTPSSISRLTALSKSDRRTVAEIIRIAVEQYLSRRGLKGE